jgi:GNAT superfamily N-acetyltransferase
LHLSEAGDLPTDLDFTESGKDPLYIHEFYYEDLSRYQESNLSTVRLIKVNEKIVGYFTVSMNAIELDKLGKDEKVKNTTPKKYPAMLIGRMGVDKKYRNKGIGYAVCMFCRGLAIDIGKKVACRYVILQTTEEHSEFYKKSGFIKTGDAAKKGIVWMYVRTV